MRFGKKTPFDRVFGGDSDDHPVDRQVAEMPEVQDARARYRRCLERLGNVCTDRTTFLRFEEASNALRYLREEAYFNLGYAYGRAAGVATREPTKKARQATKRVRDLLLGEGLTTETALRCLLAAAAAFVPRAKTIAERGSVPKASKK